MLKRVAGLATLLLLTALIIVGIITACAPLIVEQVVNKEAEGEGGRASAGSVEQAARENAAEAVTEEQSVQSESADLTAEEKLAGARAVESEALLETVQGAAEEGAIELTEEETDAVAAGEEFVQILQRGADEDRLELIEDELATAEELVQNAEAITEEVVREEPVEVVEGPAEEDAVELVESVEDEAGDEETGQELVEVAEESATGVEGEAAGEELVETVESAAQEGTVEVVEGEEADDETAGQELVEILEGAAEEGTVELVEDEEATEEEAAGEEPVETVESAAQEGATEGVEPEESTAQEETGTSAEEGIVEGVREGNLLEVLAADPRFERMTESLEITQLSTLLSGDTPFTIFAPTNLAFSGLPQGTFEGLQASPDRLAEVLRYHLVPQQVTFAELADLATLTTELGPSVSITATGTGSTLRVNEAQIAGSGIETDNGIIYVIDRVLLPPAGEEAAPVEGVVVNGVAIICSENYVIQEGDWLSRIAETRYNDPLAYPALVEATNATAAAGGAYSSIFDPNVIEVGQVICIPDADTVEQLLSE